MLFLLSANGDATGMSVFNEIYSDSTVRESIVHS